jgi:hypothetical protein
MPSLSKAVFHNGWMTISSWVVYLGLFTIAISAPASAQPVAGSEASQPESHLANTQPNTQPNAQPSTQPPAHLTEAQPEAQSGTQPESQLNEFLTTADPSKVALATDSLTSHSSEDSASVDASGVTPSRTRPAQSTRSSATPVDVAEDVADSANGSAEGLAETDNSATSSPVALSSECLADCNPTEAFAFNPSINIAIPPRTEYQRPLVSQTRPETGPETGSEIRPDSSAPSTAQLPVPRSPERPGTSSESVSPPPVSSPNFAPDSDTSPTDRRFEAEDLQGEELGRSNRPVTPPSLQLQGVYLYQGGEDSARIRLTGVYPILPELQVGASIDFTDGDVFSESGDDGLSINELYAVGSIPDYPNLRFVVGQIDLTSYFDRNSFAKDSATHFFNPVFATNPALSAAGLGSRQGAVVNWTILDGLEAKAAVFSSDRSISDFELNAFAGEVGGRLGNFILRGTYVTSEDAGANTGFDEIFSLERSNGDFGLRDGDREDAYGINAEYFIPEISLGIFARYGWYENRDLDEGGTTYSVGVNLLDLFMEGDRLGVGYGRLLSSNNLRDGENPDVLEAFYDFRVLDFLRVGVTFQGLDEFSETIAGFRIRTDFDLVPRRNR